MVVGLGCMLLLEFQNVQIPQNSQICLFIHPGDVLWYPNSVTFFLRMAWKFFRRLFKPSGLWNDQWEKCMRVCNKNKSGTASISKYVPMCTKFGTFVHWYGPSRCFFSKFFIFIGFIESFVLLGLSQLLWWNRERPCQSRFFMGYMAHSKTILLRGVLCKIE